MKKINGILLILVFSLIIQCFGSTVFAEENNVEFAQGVISQFDSSTGTAIQNMRTSYIGDNLTRDGYHLSIPMGSCI